MRQDERQERGQQQQHGQGAQRAGQAHLAAMPGVWRAVPSASSLVLAEVSPCTWCSHQARWQKTYSPISDARITRMGVAGYFWSESL